MMDISSALKAQATAMATSTLPMEMKPEKFLCAEEDSVKHLPTVLDSDVYLVLVGMHMPSLTGIEKANQSF
ncbi:hypothetical protein Tco_0668795 [Tanacetum coccineum]